MGCNDEAEKTTTYGSVLPHGERDRGIISVSGRNILTSSDLQGTKWDNEHPTSKFMLND